MMMAKTASVLWANSVLKKRDAVLAKISRIVTYEYKMKMRNAPVFCKI